MKINHSNFFFEPRTSYIAMFHNNYIKIHVKESTQIIIIMYAYLKNKVKTTPILKEGITYYLKVILNLHSHDILCYILRTCKRMAISRMTME